MKGSVGAAWGARRIQTDPLTLRRGCENSSPHLKGPQAEGREGFRKRLRVQRSSLPRRRGDGRDVGGRAGRLSK